MHESDLLPASKRSRANFNAYPQYSRIAERVALLVEGLLYSVYKENIDAMLITQI